MNKKINIYLLLFVLVSLCSCGDNDYEIYVSPNGNDTCDASYSSPIQSINQAIKLISKIDKKASVSVLLDEGRYLLKETIKIGNNDEVSNYSSLKFKAISGKKPSISGGILLNDWEKNKDGLFVASIPKYFNKEIRTLYVNGKRAVRARHPNNNYLKVAKAGADNKTNFFFNENDIPYINNTKNIELVFLHDWSTSRVKVNSINWNKNLLIAKDSIGANCLPFFTINNWEENPRYFLENAMEFCDSPGEWFYNLIERKIYFYPNNEDDINTLEIILPYLEKLISIKGTNINQIKNISFDGITFEHTYWELLDKGYCGIQACMYDNRKNPSDSWQKINAAIELDYAENCSFNNCIIRHTGGTGIWIRENCSNSKISKSHIHDISGNGISIGEGNDRLVNGKKWWKNSSEVATRNISISNCLVENCGVEFYGAVGIWAGLVNNINIVNNEIRNLPYTGISIGWMWDTTPTPCRENNVSSNYIHHVMNKLSDGGGIYFLGLQPNSLISNNIIHNVSDNVGRAESNGMFLDEGIKNVVIENNIIFNIAKSPLRFHKAFENIVKKNILATSFNIPAIRYNNTKEKHITKIDNQIIDQSKSANRSILKNTVEKKLKEIGISENLQMIKF